MKDLYTIAEAASWLSRHAEFPLTEEDVFDHLKQETLSICFRYEGNVLLFPIVRPDGVTEAVADLAPIPFEGVLKSLIPPATLASLTASLVRLIRFNCIQYKRDGTSVPGLRDAVPYGHGGYVLPGFEVAGAVDFIDIPAAEWRVHIDDLRALRQHSPVETPGDGGASETPEERRAGLLRRHRELEASGCRNPTLTLADELKVSDSRVRELLRKAKDESGKESGLLTQLISANQTKRK